LRNMRQRMREIGGQLDLQSTPGAGTRITFQVPAKTMTATC
jgi:signal transduction histidine kinase